jgi:hypothetical protein
VLSLALAITGCDDKDVVDTGSIGGEETSDRGGDGDGDGYDQFVDCDDDDAQVNPGASEICDGIDNNCDGNIDEGVTTTWYPDTDGDFFGDAAEPMEGCGQPDGYVGDATDCDDQDSGIYPGAPEVCDGQDNDCDGATDENSDGSGQIWFADNDGDGFGDEDVYQNACEQPEGYVSTNTDCDDSDPEINPNAQEVCDGYNVDEDCDGLSDDADTGDVDPETYNTWYADTDGDAFGDEALTMEACDQPIGYVANSTDCDDDDDTVNPYQAEVCGDGIDNDCNPDNDEDGSDWYPDDDEDGFGDPDGTAVTSCDDPSDTSGCSDADDSTACYSVIDTDCDDADVDTNPDATEYCDGIDNDCDGDSDESDAADVLTWYADDDVDGFGDPDDTTESCSEPSGYVSDNTDCDDTDTAINPDATEVCDDYDTDEDCNGFADDTDSGVSSDSQSPFYADSDSDGYGGSTYGLYCDAPSGYVETNGDCNDTDSSINPGATEECDGVDNDCDGYTDDEDDDTDAGGMSTWYADDDLDGYGDPDNTTDTCDQPSGYVSDDTDCDDADADINEGAEEVCDGFDNDCDSYIDDEDDDTSTDSMSTWYADDDGDGYGDEDDSLVQCDQPTGYVADGTDCDDTDAEVVTSAWYADDDGDGYGDPDNSVSDCDPGSGYVLDDQDCDDTDADINPDAVELYFDLSSGTETDNCDGIDNDCDDEIDEGCTDDDGDGVDDGAQLMFSCDPDGDGGGYLDDLCMPHAFSSSWLGSDCMYTFSPFNSSIVAASALAPADGVEFGGNTYDDVCYVQGGGSTGTFYITAVSDIGVDGSSAVDTTDSTDWVHADLSWCDYYSSTLCYNAGGSVVDYAFQAYWDGTEFTY